MHIDDTDTDHVTLTSDLETGPQVTHVTAHLLTDFPLSPALRRSNA